VQEAWPAAQIVEKRVDTYPIRVSVTANAFGRELPVWSGRQQDLFRKYGAARKRSMKAISQAVQDLKEEMEDSE